MSRSKRPNIAAVLSSLTVGSLLAVGLIVAAGPFLWMFATSLKLPGNQYDGSLVPLPATSLNYLRLFTSARYLPAQVLNSFTVSALTTIGQLVTCAMAGFVFAVFDFRGKRTIFALLMASFIIPPQVTLIPNFIIFSKLGMVGTQLPLWITAFMGGAFGTFLLRQYFSSIPTDLAEAGRVDGITPLGMFFRIYLPLGKPALAALAILTFTTSWNELLRPLIYLPSQQKLTTLTVGLSLYQANYSGQWTFLMACAVVSVLPVLLLFLAAQKQIMEGIAFTGIK